MDKPVDDSMVIEDIPFVRLNRHLGTARNSWIPSVPFDPRLNTTNNITNSTLNNTSN